MADNQKNQNQGQGGQTGNQGFEKQPDQGRQNQQDNETFRNQPDRESTQGREQQGNQQQGNPQQGSQGNKPAQGQGGNR